MGWGGLGGDFSQDNNNKENYNEDNNEKIDNKDNRFVNKDKDNEDSNNCKCLMWYCKVLSECLVLCQRLAWHLCWAE